MAKATTAAKAKKVARNYKTLKNESYGEGPGKSYAIPSSKDIVMSNLDNKGISAYGGEGKELYTKEIAKAAKVIQGRRLVDQGKTKSRAEFIARRTAAQKTAARKASMIGEGGKTKVSVTKKTTTKKTVVKKSGKK